MKNTAILGRILICYNHFNRNKYERKQKYGEKETCLLTGDAYSERIKSDWIDGMRKQSDSGRQDRD